jgi:hypothetical protein
MKITDKFIKDVYRYDKNYTQTNLLQIIQLGIKISQCNEKLNWKRISRFKKEIKDYPNIEGLNEDIIEHQRLIYMIKFIFYPSFIQRR